MLHKGDKAKAQFVSRGKNSVRVKIFTLDDILVGEGFVKPRVVGSRFEENRRLERFTQNGCDPSTHYLPVVIESYDQNAKHYSALPSMHDLTVPVVQQPKEKQYAIGRFIGRIELPNGEKAAKLRVRVNDLDSDGILVMPNNGDALKNELFNFIMRKFQPGDDIKKGGLYVALEVVKNDNGCYHVVADPEVRFS